ncbi:PREDICTED: translocation protein SEC62 [Nicrophorus vespilloides]|uniref:Translocation protein SEC62 n=1 Tax=Nicrophorus vespilloides TaxID=110193 RepID=A0ABM1M9M5_NICVS|nr:PREDICTED: translocation protein SEC62 [Nicrophorus vespilloides]
MAEKKKAKKRKEGYMDEEITDKPTKNEYAVAKWMKKNVPIKKIKFLNHMVQYFTASKALDALMESEFATGDEALFSSRVDAVHYMQVMLEHKFFHRARKVPMSESELKAKKKKKEDKAIEAENSTAEGKAESTEIKEKKKRKVRLDMHIDQRFVDCLDAYVWIYDPVPFYYWIFGTLLVLGAIGVCLFPLWPPSVRLGVYYLSVAGAGFFIFIIFLVVLRLIMFCLVWLLTAGKHHIWIFPNLTEDVGLVASFWPLYTYKYVGDGGDSNGSSSKVKKKKEKDSDAENDDTEDDGEDSDKRSSTEAAEQPSNNEPGNNGRSTSSECDNDFVMVDQDEIES